MGNSKHGEIQGMTPAFKGPVILGLRQPVIRKLHRKVKFTSRKCVRRGREPSDQAVLEVGCSRKALRKFLVSSHTDTLAAPDCTSFVGAHTHVLPVHWSPRDTHGSCQGSEMGPLPSLSPPPPPTSSDGMNSSSI